MTISVKLIHKLQHCDAEFEDAATIGTVLTHACNTFQQEENETVILSKGRLLERDVLLNVLCTSPKRPVKLMVVHKPSSSTSAFNAGFMRVAAIATVCAQLQKYDDAVRYITLIAERVHCTVLAMVDAHGCWPAHTA